MQIFSVPHYKAPYERFFVVVDVEDWLDGEEIASVEFEAIDLADDSDATSTVLDEAKCTFTTTQLKPYIRAGSEGHKYQITAQFETTEGTRGEMRVKFAVQEG